MSDMVRYALGFNGEKAALIAKELFGITANATPLPSERDQNFHLEASAGKVYVLKLKPPMLFSKDNAAELVQALDRILSEDGVRL